MTLHRIQSAEVKFIFAITFRGKSIHDSCLEDVVARCGAIDTKSDVFDFTHTSYYEEEMGRGLKKQFLSLEQLRPYEYLCELKSYFLTLEGRYAVQGKRRINLDPAYLELSKLVVASTKNFDHRIYIGDGIFGDVQLRFRHGRFVANDWTYPDYKTPEALQYFRQVRTRYAQQLKTGP